MNKKNLKILSLVILSILTPMVLAAIASGIYLGIQLTRGVSLPEGIHALQRIYEWLKPFLPYITLIPASLGVLVVVIKNRNKLKSMIQKGRKATRSDK